MALISMSRLNGFDSDWIEILKSAPINSVRRFSVYLKYLTGRISLNFFLFFLPFWLNESVWKTGETSFLVEINETKTD